MDALIGHSGFVGGNLRAQRHFDAEFRSTDIELIRGRSFHEVVCAGVTAVKWWANQNPAEDRAGIERLISHLDHVRAERFTLISTVDVYHDPSGVTEGDPPETAGLHPYGLHRAMLEDYVTSRFPRHAVIRLPALFGSGLRKNAIYDLMHDNRLDAVPAAGAFQWYPLDRLARDLDIVARAGLPLVNFATEPVIMAEIQARFFPGKRIGTANRSAPRYDMRTRHGALFGGSDGYMLRRPAVMEALTRFLSGTMP